MMQRSVVFCFAAAEELIAFSALSSMSGLLIVYKDFGFTKFAGPTVLLYR